MTHKHRIKPGYEGGKYEDGNIVFLSPTRHAMWHFAEWQRKGRWQDKTAWQGLTGLIGHEEVLAQVAVESGRRAGSNPKPMLQRQDLNQIADQIRKEYEEGAILKELRLKYNCGQGTILRVLELAGTTLRKRGRLGVQPHHGKCKPMLGKKWWNNEKEELMSFECPVGWKKGRLFGFGKSRKR